MERKRVQIVTTKMIRERSVLYAERKISSSIAAENLFRGLIGDSDREMFAVICFDTKNQPTNLSITSVGILNSTLVHTREVFKVAIISNAKSIIVCHQHPSGDYSPSKDDIAYNMIRAINLVGIDKLLMAL
jgi:DNA repair protein RadC